MDIEQQQDMGTRVGKLNIFIGSSSEGKRAVERLEELLKEFATVTKWYKNGVFAVGATQQASLVKAITSADFGVFVLTADDQTRSRKKNYFSPRDNVVFEAGISYGAIAPDRTFLVPQKVANLKVPNDLSGITLTKSFRFHKNDKGLEQAAIQIKDAIQSLGQRLTKQEIVGRARLKNKSIEVIKSATRSITLFGRDLSWIADYRVAIRDAQRKNIEIGIICERPKNASSKANVEKAKKLGARICFSEGDLGLRVTLVDHELEEMTRFLICSKQRSGDTIGYRCEIHGAQSSRVLFQTLTQLRARYL